MNKYYTPEIEEFHIGFEYEVNNDPRLNEWDKVVVERWKDCRYATDPYCDGEYRVKYLDREDIEELGFELEKIVLQEFYQEKDIFKKPDVYGYMIWKVKCQYRPDTHWFKLEALFEDGIWNTLFEGKIKNKSELKRLLKQLNIK